MSIIYRKCNNIIDFMNCSKSQLNVSYKYWLIKLSVFMWAYGWKVSVCFGWHCIHFRMFITLLKIICLIDLKITLQLWWHVRTMIMCHNWMFPRFFLVNIAYLRVHWHHIKIITTAWCYVILHLSTLEKNWFFPCF